MKRLNNATRYTIMICIGLVIFNVIFGYVFTKEAARAMRTQINERMLDISNTAAAMLNGDDLKNLTKDDIGSPEYQRVMDTLTYFQDNIELEYIYCITQKSEKEFVFSVDPTIEDPGEFGAPIVYTDALYNASQGNAGVDDKPYEDEWGEFYSSYSPVYDSEGKVVAIVAADFSTKWYNDRVRRLLFIVGGFLVFALIASCTLAIAIASQYKKFFENLIKKMNDLSEGVETLIDEVSFDSDSIDPPIFVDTGSDRRMKDVMDLLGEKLVIMQARLASHIEIIRSHAYIDGLTGMNNRTSYMEYLQILEKKMKEKPDLVFSVVVFDINQLKIINDDFGHDTGDKLIIAISQDIRDVFGMSRIYRIGGDEFVAILDDPDPSDMIKAVKDIIARKNQESPIFHDNTVEIGLSIGFATYDPANDKTYAEVFDRADNAMYADKRLFYQTHEDRRKRRS